MLQQAEPSEAEKSDDHSRLICCRNSQGPICDPKGIHARPIALVPPHQHTSSANRISPRGCVTTSSAFKYALSCASIIRCTSVSGISNSSFADTCRSSRSEQPAAHAPSVTTTAQTLIRDRPPDKGRDGLHDKGRDEPPAKGEAASSPLVGIGHCRKVWDNITACTVPPLFSAAGVVTANRPASTWQRLPPRTYRLAKPPRSGR